ncbi:MAG: hypothetical protein OEW73_00360 [Gammaproteobacteria bacterium]|nr:hypothetical protein [Gammaproteobacteria bacterium]MDH5259921.1 hypothetical protein [Gammaproteobacteria bacterium]
MTNRVAGNTETIDTTQSSSGAGSLRFTIRSQSGEGGAGWFAVNFADDLSAQFDSGEEFFIQWRQRFSPELLQTYYEGGGGFKQLIVGAGDLPGCTPSNQSGDVCAKSCTQLEVVVQNSYQRGLPQMYHSCGVKDGNYETLETSCPYSDCRSYDVMLQNAMPRPYCLWNTDYNGCFKYYPSEWMTFQLRVKIGTWYRNDRNYHYDSEIQLWVARDGQPSTLVIDRSAARNAGYDLVRVFPAGQDWEGSAQYGKVWLLPYNTGKNSSQVHPDAYTWYDELIISTRRIPDPVSSSTTGPRPSPPTRLQPTD